MTLTLPHLTATAIKTMPEVLELNQDEIRALLDLIEFHDDWDECSEQLGVNVAQLYDKVSALVTY
jgi:hypothetical protein